MQVLASLLPPSRRFLGLARLSLLDWLVLVASATGPLVVNESLKVALRERS